jgi:hypothetical protein
VLAGVSATQQDSQSPNALTLFLSPVNQRRRLMPLACSSASNASSTRYHYTIMFTVVGIWSDLRARFAVVQAQPVIRPAILALIHF